MKPSHLTKKTRLIANGNGYCNDVVLDEPIGVSQVPGALVQLHATPESGDGENIPSLLKSSVLDEHTLSTGDIAPKIDDSAPVASNIQIDEVSDANRRVASDQFPAEISPFSTGLVIVNVSDPVLLPSVRVVLGSLALDKSALLGIPMPKAANAVHSLISGTPRHIEQSTLFAKANAGRDGGSICLKVCHSQGRLDWASNEGLHVLSSFIEEAKDGWLIIEQVIPGPITLDIAQVLIRIADLAKKAGTWIMFLVVCPPQAKKSLLSEICDDYIEVELCEPEVGSVMAFSLDCIGIRDLNSLGIGKTMCSIKLSDGLFKHRVDPFISSSLETRIMWTMRGQGMTLDEIGVALKKNKSSILRRLQGLPKPRQIELPADWVTNNVETLSVQATDKCPQ